jgi:2-oxoglutarate dehydrogenase E1 component
MLRRQILRPFRHPLIVMTPKSLLRHRLATSPIQAFTEDGFLNVIGEIDEIDPESVKRIVLCAGKLYYELLETRRSRGITDTAIIRIEQLYPFPSDDFAQAIAPYRNAEELIWCQEEPLNQGAWNQIKHRFAEQVAAGLQLWFVGRPRTAAPAVGYRPVHMQQQTLIDEALTGRINPEMNPMVNQL